MGGQSDDIQIRLGKTAQKPIGVPGFRQKTGQPELGGGGGRQTLEVLSGGQKEGAIDPEPGPQVIDRWRKREIGDGHTQEIV